MLQLPLAYGSIAVSFIADFPIITLLCSMLLCLSKKVAEVVGSDVSAHFRKIALFSVLSSLFQNCRELNIIARLDQL